MKTARDMREYEAAEARIQSAWEHAKLKFSRGDPSEVEKIVGDVALLAYHSNFILRFMPRHLAAVATSVGGRFTVEFPDVNADTFLAGIRESLGFPLK